MERRRIDDIATGGDGNKFDVRNYDTNTETAAASGSGSSKSKGKAK